MRARAGLAQALWETGEREATIDHYRDMLRLNPNDNQGIRDELAICYLEMDRDDDLTKLLERYKEDPSALWLYTRALVAYRREGDSERSRNLLAKAVEMNGHVPALLLGTKAMPKRLSPYMTWRGEDEAAHYVIAGREGWLRSTGALRWLRERTAAFSPTAKQ
jgi:tetratricopeptide (TPR) repeat protein